MTRPSKSTAKRLILNAGPSPVFSRIPYRRHLWRPKGPHPARCATFSKERRTLIGQRRLSLLPWRSCRNATDEVPWLDRLISADNDNGTTDDRLYAYDDADNMVRNSGLCAANPNMVYPAATVPRPHAPTAICGAPVSYDNNGNTTSYDVDGPGPEFSRVFVYDGENRPIIILRNGLATTMSYGPDGERASKSFNGATTHYLGNDTEIRFDAATPLGLITSYLHPDVRREGALTDFLIKDHLNTNRLTIRYSLLPIRFDFSPYGRPG